MANFTATCHRKLVVAYKQIFRNFMKCQRLDTTAPILAWNIHPHAAINRKLAFGFRKWLLLCDNFMVQPIDNSLNKLLFPILLQAME